MSYPGGEFFHVRAILHDLFVLGSTEYNGAMAWKETGHFCGPVLRFKRRCTLFYDFRESQCSMGHQISHERKLFDLFLLLLPRNS